MNIEDLQDELKNYLNTQIITSDNIGDIRRNCFMPWDSSWNMFIRDETAKRESRPYKDDNIVEKYYELLYAVGRKYPNETRHETALRYILNAEKDDVVNYADVRKEISNQPNKCCDNGNFNESHNCQKSQSPNKNVKVPEYDYLTEGFDPAKLKKKKNEN
jgi:hypothetical protein